MTTKYYRRPKGKNKENKQKQRHNKATNITISKKTKQK